MYMLGPWCDVPTAKSSLEDVHEYNDEALGLFFEHAENCLLCRSKNASAQQAAQSALGKTVSRRKKMGLQAIHHSHSSAELLKEKDTLMQTSSKKSVKKKKKEKRVQISPDVVEERKRIESEKEEKEAWIREHDKVVCTLPSPSDLTPCLCLVQLMSSSEENDSVLKKSFAAALLRRRTRRKRNGRRSLRVWPSSE